MAESNLQTKKNLTRAERAQIRAQRLCAHAALAFEPTPELAKDNSYIGGSRSMHTKLFPGATIPQDRRIFAKLLTKKIFNFEGIFTQHQGAKESTLLLNDPPVREASSMLNQIQDKLTAYYKLAQESSPTEENLVKCERELKDAVAKFFVLHKKYNQKKRWPTWRNSADPFGELLMMDQVLNSNRAKALNQLASDLRVPEPNKIQTENRPCDAPNFDKNALIKIECRGVIYENGNKTQMLPFTLSKLSYYQLQVEFAKLKKQYPACTFTHTCNKDGTYSFNINIPHNAEPGTTQRIRSQLEQADTQADTHTAQIDLPTAPGAQVISDTLPSPMM